MKKPIVIKKKQTDENIESPREESSLVDSNISDISDISDTPDTSDVLDIPIHDFDQVSVATTIKNITPTNQNQIRVISYNISRQERSHDLRQIILHLKENSPDLICFQEVTPQSYQYLVERLSGYRPFQAFVNDGHEEGIVSFIRLSKYRVLDPAYYDFTKTKEYNHILDCEIQNKTTRSRLHLINTRLDRSSAVRDTQIDDLHTLIKTYDNVILCGDFTLKTIHDDEQFNILNLKDSWRQIGCSCQVKYTYDAKKNRNVPDERRERPDRILFKSDKECTVDAFKLIGVGTKSQLPPSEHFGVMVCLKGN